MERRLVTLLCYWHVSIHKMLPAEFLSSHRRNITKIPLTSPPSPPFPSLLSTVVNIGIGIVLFVDLHSVVFDLSTISAGYSIALFLVLSILLIYLPCLWAKIKGLCMLCVCVLGGGGREERKGTE